MAGGVLYRSYDAQVPQDKGARIAKWHNHPMIANLAIHHCAIEQKDRLREILISQGEITPSSLRNQKNTAVFKVKETTFQG